MRLRIIQKDITRTGFDGYLEAASESGIDVLCFNELSATGCLYEAQEVPDLQHWLDFLRGVSCTVMFGAPVHKNGQLYNAYMCVEKDQVQQYHKINLFEPFNEPSVYHPGDSPGLFDTSHGQFGVAICYDIRFDDIFRRFHEIQVPRIVIPAAFPRARIEDWRRLLVQRAKETSAIVIGVNAVGDDGVNEFGGSSMVVGPDGTVLAQAREEKPEVLDIEL